MTHFVETWLLTDHDALVRFFKRGFAAKYLPTTELEERSKDDVEKALKKATKDCQRGCYRHGQAHEVIEKVAPEKVKTLFHGSRLFEEMDKLIRDIP